jgi:Surface lipoprotein
MSNTAFRFLSIPLITLLYFNSGVTAQTLQSLPEGSNGAVVNEDLYNHEVDVQDPFEPLNRGIFAVNTFVDGLLFKPLAYAYEDLVAVEIRSSVSNFFDNLASPVTLANDILQIEPESAVITLARFVINSTIGLLGLFDPAADIFELYPEKRDFGQTLRKWGFGSGPYLVLPLLGPASVRDAGGQLADYFIDPYNSYMRVHDKDRYIYFRTGATLLVKRQSLLKLTDELDRTPDPYAQYRILYMQNRKMIETHDSPGLSPDDVVAISAGEDE